MVINMKTIYVLLIIFLFSTIAYAGKGGKPSDNLQQQLDELRLRIEILEQASRGIDVYDNNGQYLGLLVNVNSIAPGGTVTIYIPSVQSTITLQNSTGDLGGDPYIYLYFKEAGCVGQPYTRIERQLMIGKNSSKYYKSSGTPAETLYYESLRAPDGDCNPEANVRDAIAVEEVQLPFTLPAALTLSSEY